MNVLLTKKLAQDQLDLIQSWGWNCEVVEALKITLIEVNEVPVKADAWIVSSRNSLTAIKEFIGHAPRWVYCVGDWMKTELEKLNRTISVRAFEDVKALVKELVRENFRHVIYFCGREHRQELEEGLISSKTKITKAITHESEMTFPVVKNLFDVVFVFSPRSAESLLQHNRFSSQTIFACIGPTTAAYLHHEGITNTFVPSYPDSAVLLNELHSKILNLKS